MAKEKSDIHPSADKPSGEFTFLSVDKAADAAQLGVEAEIEFSTAGITTSSLRRLESDIRQLRSKWQNVERALRARDTRISQLLTELEEKDSNAQRLEDDLQAAKVEQRRLTDALRGADEKRYLTHSRDEELRERICEHEAQLSQKDLAINALDEQLAANDAEIGSLRNQLEALTGSRNKLQAKLALANEKNLESEAVFGAMRAEIETLEAELCAKRDLIEVLVNNRSADKETIDTLDQSVDRTTELDADARGMDCNVISNKLDNLSPRAQHLIVAIDPDGGVEIRYPLYKREMTIGRSRKADIQIPNMYISRMHARISRQGSKAIIQDTCSTNGFLVNSEASRRRELMHGDRLNIGTMEFEFVDLSVDQQTGVNTTR